MNEAAALGTEFHSKVEETFVRQGPLDDDSLTGRMADGVWAWAEKEGFKPVETEVSMTSAKYLVGGTPDAIGRFHRSNELVVIDYKSSSGMREGFALQLAAYAALYNEVHGLTWSTGISRGMCVRADKKEQRITPEIKPYADLRTHWKVFLAQRAFYEWLQQGPDLAYLLDVLKGEI